MKIIELSASPSRARAFTYIELLTVVAIVMSLAAIAVPNFLEAQTRAKVSASKANLSTTLIALEAYRTENHCYPYSGNHFTNLKVLTTPVPFMTEQHYDVMSAPAVNPEHPDYEFNNTHYRYICATDDWTPEGVLVYDEASAPLFPAYGRCLIWGYGPHMHSSPTAIGEDGVITATAYDPTNGTISRGDIYVWAGTGSGRAK